MPAAGPLDIATFTSPDFGQNAYLAAGPDGGAAVIDPGGTADRIADELLTRGLRLEGVLLTHAHLDHIEGVATLLRRVPAPLHLHPADRPLYDAIVQQAMMFGLDAERQPPPDRELADGAVLDVGGCRFEVRHVPGHSPGHVLFYCEAAKLAFVGDLIFSGSIGRTDLPGGSFQTLIRSIRERVLTLPPETTLLCGHGPPTTVRHEAGTNPFLVPQYGGGLA